MSSTDELSEAGDTDFSCSEMESSPVGEHTTSIEGNIVISFQAHCRSTVSIGRVERSCRSYRVPKLKSKVKDGSALASFFFLR